MQKALATNEVDVIRAALDLEINDKKNTTEDLLRYLKVVRSSAPDVFVPFEEGRFMGSLDRDKSNWTTDELDSQMVYLGANFSVERFRHVVSIRQHLRESGSAGF